MKKNIILITIDCLRNDLFEEALDKSKLLKDFLNESTYFKKAYTTGGFTPSSLTGFIASRYCEYNNRNVYLPCNSDLVYKVLQKNGFKTGIIHSDPFISDMFGYNENVDMFEPFYETKKDNPLLLKIREKLLKFPLIYKIISNLFLKSKLIIKGDKSINPKIESEKVFSKGREFVNKFIGNKKFLWMHTMDLHGPLFDIDEKISNKKANDIFIKANQDSNQLNDEEKEIYKTLYNKNLDQLLKNIEEFINFLKTKKEYEKSMIIITADHGEAIFENERYGHRAVFSDETINVPLIIKDFKGNNGVFNDVVSLVDLPPTILNEFEIPIPKSYIGTNLFKSPKDFAIIKNIYKEPFKEPISSINEKYKENFAIIFNDFRYIKENKTEIIIPEEKSSHAKIKKCQGILDETFQKGEIKNLVEDIEI